MIVCSFFLIFPFALCWLHISLTSNSAFVSSLNRYLGTLKGYVRNKARPEGSIAEAYIVNECLSFCSMYLEGIETKFNRAERNYDGEAEDDGFDVFSQKVRPFGAFTYDFLSEKEREMTHWYVLTNCEKVEPYLM